MRVVPDPVLARRTTLRLGGTAIAEIVLEHEQDVDGLGEQLTSLGGKPLILGEGSNILAKDGRLDLVLVRLTGKTAPEIVEQDEKSVLIRVPAALRLPRLLGWCRSRGICGLEQWTGIPGSVGGAVAMNAGSYGLEMSQVLERVRIWTPEHGSIWKESGDVTFGYRHFDSGISDPTQLILQAELRLGLSGPDMIHARMQQWYGRKKQSQPVTMASAGCVFKNPDPRRPAGLLLEQAGLRGFAVGKMAFSTQHANFMVNLGGGRSDDAFALLAMARERVFADSGVELTTEVRIVP